jgi:glycosyltransferase involved in cell wall biosynthesis
MTNLAENTNTIAYGNRLPIVAVIIPCLNEEQTINSVIYEFRVALPEGIIFVYDNGSTDKTMAKAKSANVIVRSEPMRGKGNVVRRMFSDIEADVFILVDGDATYEASSAPHLVRNLLEKSLDMINAARISEEGDNPYRFGHRFGNRLLTNIVSFFFGNRITDLLSGYRVLSRRFVKSYPALASGFDIETELSVHALQMRMPFEEIPVKYRERPQGSKSKLNTYRDGLRILRTITYLIKEEKPLAFFATVAAFLMTLALALGTPVVLEFMETGLVLRFPTAILASAIMILAFLSFTCGLIVDSIRLSRIESKRLAYLNVSVRFHRDDFVSRNKQ